MIKLRDVLNEMGLRTNPKGELDNDAPDAHSIVNPNWSSKKEKLKIKNGMIIFPAFVLKKVSSSRYNEFSAKQMNAIRRAVKNPRGDKSKEVIDFYIKRSLFPLKHFLPVEKIDTIIPLGSSSGINKRIAEAIKTVAPKAQVLTDAVKKGTWKDVEIDYEGLERESKGDESLKYLESYLKGKQKNHPDETMKVSGIKMSLRRYLKNFMRLNPEFKKEVLESNIYHKNVLVIDDTMEEGATMEAAYSVISSLSPKDIMIYIFLFTEGTGRKKKSPPDYEVQSVNQAQFDV